MLEESIYFYITCWRKARLCVKLPEQPIGVKRRCIGITTTQEINLTAEKRSDGEQLVEYELVKSITGETELQSTSSCHG